MNMLYKKSLLKAAIATLLLTFVSSSSFSSPYGSILDNEYYDDYSEDYSYYGTDLEEEKSSNFYMSFNYNGVNSGISSFDAKEDTPGIKTERILSLDSNGRVQEGYNPEYNGGFAGNASIGYKAGNFRVELEGLVSSVTSESEYVELYRCSPDNSVGVYDYYIKGEDGTFESATLPHRYEWESIDDDGVDRGRDGKQKRQLHSAFKIKNEGFRNIAAMVNAYYSLNNESNFTPHVGIGAGLTNIKFLGTSHFKPSYQGKAGLSYNVNDAVQIFAGYKYFGVLGNILTKANPTVKIPDIYYDNKHDTKVGYAGSTTATVESKFANHALEVGLTIDLFQNSFRKLKIVNTGNQIEPQPETFSSVSISICDNFKSFEQPNHVFNHHSFARKLLIFYFLFFI